MRESQGKAAHVSANDDDKARIANVCDSARASGPLASLSIEGSDSHFDYHARRFVDGNQRELKSHLTLAPLSDSTASSIRLNRAPTDAAQTPKKFFGNDELETLYFPSQGTRCEAWLMRPAVSGRAPLVIMAHGFAAEKSFGLLDYARQFVARGLAVLLFDYRCFGGSEGEPRNLVSLQRQRQDWQAAVDFANTLPGIDPRLIALWGTSFSGGHVLMCAADNPQIAAVVAQAPMLDVPTSFRGYKISYAIQAMWHAGRDLLRAAVGRAPHMVPVVGDGSKFAVMNKPGCEAGYRRIVPQDAQWANACPARVLFTSLFYRPGRNAWRVNCPTLLLLEAEDQLIPRRVVHQAAARMCDVTVVSLWGDHFDPYAGGASFDRALQLESDFLERCLNRAQNLQVLEGSTAEVLQTSSDPLHAGRRAA